MNPLSRIVRSDRARILALAALLGALGACGFEPLHAWPLALVSLAGLGEIVARSRDWRDGALAGWAWGVGHFCVGNAWIATSFVYQANMPYWLGWIAVFLLSLYLAVFPALAALGSWFARGNRLAMALAFASAWIVSEWMRGWVFTGYAWNPLAMVLLGPFDGQGLAMAARWTGTYGLSGIVVLLACLLREVGLQWHAQRCKALALAALLAVLLAPMAVRGTIPAPEGWLAYTLVQPDFRQETLDDPALYESQFVRLARLSQQREPGARRLVLWPESGLPDYLREGYPKYFYAQTTFSADPGIARRRIGRVIGPDSLLLTGAVDLEVRDGEAIAARNSITALDGDGAIRGGYAKAHLVPYGEYLPLRWLLEPLGASRLVAGTLDFWPGPGPRTLDLGGWGKAGMQICYEIVFSGQVVDRRHRPDYIFNPSNDGWFGAWGPPQHLAQARMRAVEEGLPVLRATTTGISAVIDADGIVREHLARQVSGRIDALVPPPHRPTLFARVGNALSLGLALLMLGFALLVLRRASR